MNKAPKFTVKESSSEAAVPGQIVNSSLDSLSKELKSKQFDISNKNTALSSNSREQMTPGVVGSFNQNSNLTANTPWVEEYFLSRTSSQQKKLDVDNKSEKESLPSNQKKPHKSTNEHIESINELDSDSSDNIDDDEDEDYEEECKGKSTI